MQGHLSLEFELVLDGRSLRLEGGSKISHPGCCPLQDQSYLVVWTTPKPIMFQYWHSSSL